MKKLGALWIIATLTVACAAQDTGGDPGGDDVDKCGDNMCESTETAKSCPQDCEKPVCGNTMCETGETPTSCPADCHLCGNNICEPGEDASCPSDCPASLVVENNSSYTVYNLYAEQCGGSWSGDQTGASYILPGATFTLTGIPPGCWEFRATTSGDALYWQTNPTTMAPNQQYTWPLGN